jgi:hypothetical protein
MDDSRKINLRLGALLFCTVMLLALGWALATDHVWEDYYITYRSSKNLVTGHGLVFNHGERLHTFTSPLGVLLPAAACALTGNSSDTTALWVFRVWSAAALGGAVVLLWAVARRYFYGRWAVAALVVLVLLDGKTLDFTINGMETGFLLLFIAYTLWSMLAGEGRRWRHLGLAWAGLMWTRPDGFLYIGLLSAGVFLFNDPARTGLTRPQWLKVFVQAGLLCTVVYLPWFLWAWWYYGSPVPHTIVAKGNISGDAKTLLGALKTALNFPWTVWQGQTSLEGAFLPSYFQLGGWPTVAVMVARGLGLVLAFQWVLPWRVEVRTASFAFCGLHVYLSYFPYFPFPWYLPGTTLLAVVVVGGIMAQTLAACDRLQSSFPAWTRLAGLTVAGFTLAMLGAQTWLSWQMMREMKVEQELSATAVRRKTGEWLHDHARPGDTVFMEPLGHIGYFSGLKTFDYPGLSSREVVRAIKVIRMDWAFMVEYLSPDWMVLRPFEIDRMRYSIARLFSETYEKAAEFNTLDQIRERSVYGRNYIEFDAHLTVFHRVKPSRYRVDVSSPAALARFPLGYEYLGPVPTYKLHATGLMSIKVPPGARHVSLVYGLPAGTYQGDVVTDGVEFQARFVDDHDNVNQLFKIHLDPVQNPADRGIQRFEADLPLAQNGELVLICLAGPSDVMDWSCWGIPEFKF